MKKLAVAALMLLVTPPAWAQKTATTLPKEFRGIWIIADETENECRKQNWTTRQNDRLINVTAKAIEEWESGCTIKSVKTSRDLLPGARTAEVNLSCGGEGLTWSGREIWHVRNVNNCKIFAATGRTSDARDEGSGKKVRDMPGGLTGSIYLECK